MWVDKGVLRKEFSFKRKSEIIDFCNQKVLSADLSTVTVVYALMFSSSIILLVVLISSVRGDQV